MSSSDKVLLEINDSIAVITLNRPKVLNALDQEMLDQLWDIACQVGTDRKIRAVLLKGEGRAFCAGGDVKNMMAQAMSNPNVSPAVLAKRGAGRLHQVVTEFRNMPKPVMAAIAGPCAGAGVGIALSADILWASQSSTFTLAYTKIGLSPDGGTTYLLTRAVGEKAAMDLFLTSRKIDADEALKLGLISRVLPDEELDLAVAQHLGQLAKGATRAYATAKKLVYNSLREGIETHLERETEGVARNVMSADFMEGVSAFMQKRDPEFKGK